MAAQIILPGLAGALVALVLVALIDPDGRLPHLLAAALAVGIFGGIGLDRLIRG